MLKTKDIEELAISAVKSYFNTCALVSPHISDNDKTPDWDGTLDLYEKEKDVRKNFFGSIGIQVKGKLVKDFKGKTSYPVETVFLSNALNKGFIFFVVKVKENGETKIFYKTMAPIEIRGEMSKIKNRQQTRTISFEPLSMDKDWVYIMLKSFYTDCIKQTSFANKKVFNVDDISNAKDIQFGFSYYGKKDSIAYDLLHGIDSFMYVKTKEGAEIPLGDGRMKIMIKPLRKTIQFPVSIDGNIICNSYSSEMDSESILYIIDDLLSISVNYRTSNKGEIKIIADSTHTQIKAYEIFYKIVKAGVIKFGNSEVKVNTERKAVLLSKLENHIADLNVHLSVLKKLNIETKIDYKNITDKDNHSFRQLYKALIENLPIKLTNPHDIFNLKIANLNILMVCKKVENGKYYLYDAFESSLLSVKQMSDTPPFEAPIFSAIMKEGYEIYDNIPYKRMIDEYEAYALKDSRIYAQANLDLLEILKAADELKKKGNADKSNRTLNTAESLAKWLLDNDTNDEFKNIHRLNCLQIAKRRHCLTATERLTLTEMTIKSDTLMIKAGAYLLLGNDEFFEYTLSQMSEEDQNVFRTFPIYIFANKNNIYTKE